MLAAVFKNNRSQAVRLPKEVALPSGVKHVTVSVLGDTRILTPVDEPGLSWESFLADLPVDDGFLPDRRQGVPDARQW
ncbi:MAG: type II toxin-antitoxin system VapB family antitoxin [Propionibacteriaceae bacterium]|jgi:antitoxin VapB|nr:type II toxin-antitoxin system VapB family antitoxin [Propionibacteriaceae bacterium]